MDNLDIPYNENYVIMGKEFVDTCDERKITLETVSKHIVFIYNDINLVPNKVFYNWKQLNPDYKIIFFNFEDGVYLLEKKLGIKYKTIFNKITYAPHKSDFFRLCFLYVYGGIYSDIDNYPIRMIEDFITPFKNITFCTSLSINNNSIAQAIILSTKQNSIIKQNIDTYLEISNKLDDNINNKNYSGAALAGTNIMYNNILNILMEHNQIKTTIRPHTMYIIKETHKDKIFFNKIVLLDEYTPNGSWKNSFMRTGFHTVIKCRYDDYPWFGHNRNPDQGYETFY